ncbi:MAG: endolytic transglycosylase MltG [Prevotellaceae bacterium]|jgi:UPF0755 protein|nr:endolytic transglycosylase MltG [Prevotellaceae bacterium]
MKFLLHNFLRPRWRTVLFTLLALAGSVFIFSGLGYYYCYYAPNVTAAGGAAYLYIHAGATYGEVIDSLDRLNVLRNAATFRRAAEREHYPDNIHAGRYKLTSGMSNKMLIRLLLLGSEEPVRLTLAGHIRTNRRLADLMSRYIEPDSLMLLAALNDAQLTAEYGFTPATIMGMFIPDTYEVYWGITVKALLKRMKREYDAFWNGDRRAKAAALGMTQQEVVTLASIVYEETLKPSEMPRVAGVYVNRLTKGIPLQADPTLKYAVGDFTLRRILNRHKTVESPYNTYLYAGLPPGPICVPPAAAIDAVLNCERHEYLYFCAKADFSGYHSFSKTLAQHNEYACAYHEALDERAKNAQ